MVRRDYRKEVGLKSATPRIPWPIALVVLAACGCAIWFGVNKLHQHEQVVKGRSTAAAATTSPAD